MYELVNGERVRGAVRAPRANKQADNIWPWVIVVKGYHTMSIYAMDSRDNRRRSPAYEYNPHEPHSYRIAVDAVEAYARGRMQLEILHRMEAQQQPQPVKE